MLIVELMVRQLIFIVFTLTIASLKVCGQQIDNNDSTQSPRLMVSISADPFFFVYPYAAPNVGLECRISDRFAINTIYGLYRSTGLLKHHIKASGTHSNTQLRYYSRKYSPYFFSLNYGYQELTRPVY